MHKTTRYVALLLMAALLSSVLACSSTSSSDHEGKTTSATVSIAVQAQSQNAKFLSFLGTVNDITSLTVDVLNGSTPLITGQQLTYSGGVWSGTLEDLPIGPALTFIGHAYNVSAVEIFTGTTVQALTGHSDAVTILMTPVSDGMPALFPRITRIIVPSEILSSSTVTIGVWVEGSSGETLAYAAAAAAGGGSLSPTHGTINLGGTTGTLVLSYTAPSAAGTYTHSIKVTNSQGNWVETDFSTVISGIPTASPTLTVQFCPVITAIGAKRNGSDVTFAAVVSDAGPLNELVYSWGFDGGLNFVDNTMNPVVLQGYDETRSGNVTLTITNGAGGSTTISFYIAPGLLPDSVVWNGAPGTLDTAFNGRGWVAFERASGRDITTDSNGRILVTGSCFNAAGTTDMVIWRYNSDGTLDPTFNGLGWVSHNNAGGNGLDGGNGITTDSNGRILVAGYSNSIANIAMVVWRYNADGTLDTSFNGQGWVAYNSAIGRSITIDSSGKILVTGDGGSSDMVIWRYNPNGALDTTFNSQGWVAHNSAAGGNGTDVGYGIRIDSIGRILVTGYSWSAAGTMDMVIWRYNANGTLDTSFNSKGWVTHNNAAGGNGFDSGQNITIDSIGRILVAGISESQLMVESDMVVWRYNANGTLDTTFNGKGWVTHNNAGGGDNEDYAYDIALDSSGRILVAGGSESVAQINDDMAIWRYNPDGALDTTFNGLGWVTFNGPFIDSYDVGYGITIDSNGRILVAGESADLGGYGMAVWRYNP